LLVVKEDILKLEKENKVQNIIIAIYSC